MERQEMKGDGKDSVCMHPNIWGDLQHHIELSNVYAKLPFREFFQMRLVCKEWNLLASDRKFLENNFKELIPKPYFFLRARGQYACHEEVQLHGLLTHNKSSDLWSWTRLPTLSNLSTRFNVDATFVAVEGLLHVVYENQDKYEQAVFNIHTRVCHTLPQSEILEALLFETGLDQVSGLVVDTSVHPCTFKLIQGSHYFLSQSYDAKSNSWELRASERIDTDRFPHGPAANFRQAHCAQCNGCVHIKSTFDRISVYDIKKDAWRLLTPPLPIDEEDDCFGIGAWQGRLFEVSSADDMKYSYAVWELVDELNGDWKEFLRMPDELSAWLNHSHNAGQRDPFIQIHTSFCDEFVLVCSISWIYGDARATRFVTCNLSSREWKKVELSITATSICGHEDTGDCEDYYEGSDGYEASDESKDSTCSEECKEKLA